MRRARPASIPTSGHREKANEFNHLLGVDLKEVMDVEGERHIFLSILDVATRYSVFARVASKDSSVVAEEFQERWVRPYGHPGRVIHDQGGEFFKHFKDMLRKQGITPYVTATEAPWQNGMVERHGQVLGEIVSRMVDTSQLSGTKGMNMAGVFSATVKD